MIVCGLLTLRGSNLLKCFTKDYFVTLLQEAALPSGQADLKSGFKSQPENEKELFRGKKLLLVTLVTKLTAASWDFFNTFSIRNISV